MVLCDVLFWKWSYWKINMFPFWLSVFFSKDNCYLDLCKRKVVTLPTHCASRSQCSALSEDKDYRDEDVTINQLIILKKVSKLKLWFVVVAQSSCIQQGACFSHMIAFSAARKLCDNYWTKGGWVISPLLHVLFCDSGGTWLTTVLTMWDESSATENLAFSTLLQA